MKRKPKARRAKSYLAAVHKLLVNCGQAIYNEASQGDDQLACEVAALVGSIAAAYQAADDFTSVADWQIANGMIADCRDDEGGAE